MSKRVYPCLGCGRVLDSNRPMSRGLMERTMRYLPSGIDLPTRHGTCTMPPAHSMPLYRSEESFICQNMIKKLNQALRKMEEPDDYSGLAEPAVVPQVRELENPILGRSDSDLSERSKRVHDRDEDSDYEYPHRKKFARHYDDDDYVLPRKTPHHASHLQPKHGEKRSLPRVAAKAPKRELLPAPVRARSPLHAKPEPKPKAAFVPFEPPGALQDPALTVELALAAHSTEPGVGDGNVHSENHEAGKPVSEALGMNEIFNGKSQVSDTRSRDGSDSGLKNELTQTGTQLKEANDEIERLNKEVTRLKLGIARIIKGLSVRASELIRGEQVVRAAASEVKQEE